MPTIACNNHSGEEDMETERCMEAEDEYLVADLERCSMDHATQDMQVGHTHGSQLAAVVAVVGMESHQPPPYGKAAVATAVECHKEVRGGCNRALLAARAVAGSNLSEDEHGACFRDLFVAAKRLFEFDEAVRLFGSWKHLCSYPEN